MVVFVVVFVYVCDCLFFFVSFFIDPHCLLKFSEKEVYY